MPSLHSLSSVKMLVNHLSLVSRSALKGLLTLIPFLLFSCSQLSVEDHSGVGNINQMGSPEGKWTLYADVNGSLFAKGVYIAGEPHGKWEIYDNSGTRNAILNFQNGTYSGEYRLFYTSYSPDAAGMLKTKGYCKYGAFTGDYIRLLTNGEVFVDYSAYDGKITSVYQGERSDAKKQLSADKKLLEIYYEAILAAPAKQSS